MPNNCFHSVVTTFSALALSAGIAFGQSGKEPLAVTPVKPTASLQKAMAGAGKTSSLDRVTEAFDGQLIDRLNATRKFEIVGRSDLKPIIEEQAFAASGNVSAQAAAQAGKLTGATYLIVTTVDDFEDSTERMEFKTLNKVGLKRKIRLSAVAKVYNSTTGKLLESASFKTEKKDDRTDSTDLQKNAELTDALLTDIVREHAEKVATRVADVVFPVRVLVKRDKQITINRGEGAGVEVGQVWNVYALGEELIDPDTKEVLGREEVRVGKAKITAVNPKTSTAEILEDTGIDKGAVLRPAK
jgi:curli biogenesis system outer membrane secretion channel CsgG